VCLSPTHGTLHVSVFKQKERLKKFEPWRSRFLRYNKQQFTKSPSSHRHSYIGLIFTSRFIDSLKTTSHLVSQLKTKVGSTLAKAASLPVPRARTISMKVHIPTSASSAPTSCPSQGPPALQLPPPCCCPNTPCSALCWSGSSLTWSARSPSRSSSSRKHQACWNSAASYKVHTVFGCAPCFPCVVML